MRLLLLSAVFLTGCATTPLVLEGNHPASPSAPESSAATAVPMLHPDADTMRTRQLISDREAKP